MKGDVMANIQKRGDSYRIRVSDGFDTETDARRYRTMTWTPEPGMTENQIEKELKRQAVLFEEYCRKQAAEGDGMSLESFIKRGRREYAVVRFKNTTLAYYDDLLRRILPALGHLKLSEIAPVHISKFYSNLREQGICIDVHYSPKVDFRSFISENNISRQKLAYCSGISMMALESLISGKNVSRKSAEKVCEALERDVEELFTSVDKQRTI